MEEIETGKLKNRDGEKGAVLVMALLISFLLLVASAGILLETTVNTANVSDATADQQAYAAAESGIQSTLNVLRGNVPASPQFDTTKLTTDAVNQIDFKKALNKSSSNLSTDSAAEPPRLSRWGMKYDPDRVKFGDVTKGEYAYKIALADPDDTSSSLTYTTVSGSSGIYDPSSATFYSSSVSFGSGTSSVKITYNPKATTVVDFSKSSTVDLGNFQVELGGVSGTIPQDVRFQILLTTTKPYEGDRALYGVIRAGTFYSNAVSPNVKYEFYSPASEILGSVITLDSRSITPGPTNVDSGKTSVTGTITPAEPRRLLIRSVGFGPRGATKQLEAIVQKNYFDGLSAPAALTMIGSSAGFSFSPGNSNNVLYSGDDIASTINIPSIGVTNKTNLDSVIKNPPKTAINPPPTDVAIEVPDWLSSPAKLDATITDLYEIAVKAKRVYGSNGLTPPDLGDVSKGQGITFIDGDASFSGSGGGILVCTGKLTLNGRVDFKGLIIITGEGGFERDGGGGGTLQGNTVIAPYSKSRMLRAGGVLPADKSGIGTSAADFLGPKYAISGGGNSTLQYNSSSVNNGLNGVNNIVLGIAEK